MQNVLDVAEEISFSLRPAFPRESVGAIWRELEQVTDTPFFLSWAWIGTWLKCLPSEIFPQLLIATRGNKTVAAAILVARRVTRRGVLSLHQLHFNSTGDPKFDCLTLEHNGFVARDAGNPDLWQSFLKWFSTCTDADELVVPYCATGPVAPPDGKLLRDQRHVPAYFAGLQTEGMAAILNRFSRGTRAQLRRNLREWEKLGLLRIETAPSAEAALAWFDEMKRLHVAYWTERGQQHAFHHPFWETFHRALITAGTSGGSVRVRRAAAGTHVLGYLYDFRVRGHVYAYQSGFDRSRAELRPGYVSHLLAMEQDARENAEKYDFLGGDNQLKRSLGTDRYALYTCSYTKPRPGLVLESIGRSIGKRFRF